MEKKIRKYTIILSVVLHLIIFFIAERTVDFKLLGTGDIPETVNEPIVFNLDRDETPRQVIETTEDQRSDKKAEKPDYLSDKNTSARNPDTAAAEEKDRPYSEGDLDIPALPEISEPGDPERTEKKNRDEKEKNEEIKTDDTDIISETEKKVPDLLKNEPVGNIRNQLMHRNILSKVKELGGFAFNTYDWNFAPYMLELKRRIQSNIFPPIAFSRLGIIDGETLLKFRIYPDGRLEGPELMNFKGHRSLMDTSVNAVEISAPFPVLPEDFPEPYLEVTGKFIYFIKR